MFCASLCNSGPRDLFTGEHYFNEYGRIVAPVDADMIINPLHQGIAPILHLQAIDAVRNFFGANPAFRNDCHR